MNSSSLNISYNDVVIGDDDPKNRAGEREVNDGFYESIKKVFRVAHTKEYALTRWFCGFVPK